MTSSRIESAAFSRASRWWSLIALVFLMTLASTARAAPSANFAPPLRVVGAKLLDRNNKVVRLMGLNVFDADKWADSTIVYNLRDNWKVNVVRLILRPERWFIGKDSAEQETYLRAVDRFLGWTRRAGVYVIFDGYHESGSTGPLAKHWPYVQQVWPILAKRYRTQDHILWEIYNEPYRAWGDTLYPGTVTWADWAPKARQLIDTIRAYKPVVNAMIVPGVDWASVVQLDKDSLYRPEVIYSFHPYAHVYGTPWSVEKWQKNFGYLMEKNIAPLLAGEWDAGDSLRKTVYAPLFTSYLRQIGAHWTYWGYFPGWGGLVSNGPGSPEVRTVTGDWLYAFLREESTLQPVGIDAPSRVDPAHSEVLAFVGSGTVTVRARAGEIVRLRIVDATGSVRFSSAETALEAVPYRKELPAKLFGGGFFLAVQAGERTASLPLPLVAGRTAR